MESLRRMEEKCQIKRSCRIAQQNLGKRSRYYHSQIDMELLLSGMPYELLSDVYVIFICDFDPFGRNMYRYTFDARCKEDTGLSLKDGSNFLNHVNQMHICICYVTV